MPEKRTKTKEAEKQRARRQRTRGREGPVAQYEEQDLLALQRAVARPDLASPADVLALQRTVGNRFVISTYAYRPRHQPARNQPPSRQSWLRTQTPILQRNGIAIPKHEEPALKGEYQGRTIAYDEHGNEIAGGLKRGQCTVYETETDHAKVYMTNGENAGVTAYVPKTAVRMSSHGHTVRHHRTGRSLFHLDGQPRPRDVLQGLPSDCYLLAALLSLARQHPEKIQDMIKEKGGTVEVTLYKKVDDRFEPVKITVLRTELKGRVARIGAKKWAPYHLGPAPLWPAVLEKAYAKFHGGYEAIGNTNDEDVRRTVMETFLGVSQENIDIRKVEEGQEEEAKLTIVYPGYKGMRTGFSDAEDTANALKKYHSDNGPNTGWSQAIKSWQKYLSENESNIEDELNLAKPDESRTPTIEYMEAKIDGAGIASPHDQRIKEYYREFLHGAAHQGIYPPRSEQLFNKIRDAINKHYIVTISTGSTVSGTGLAGREGEKFIKGIRFNHAYEVAGTSQGWQKKYIKVRNPWGVRKIWPVAAFKVELSQFVQIFQKLRIANPTERKQVEERSAEPNN